MNRNHLYRLTPLLLATSALLTACGGDDHDVSAPAPAPAPAPVSSIPASATTSAAGATAFVKTQVSASSETAEPAVTADEVLGTSETEEPDPAV